MLVWIILLMTACTAEPASVPATAVVVATLTPPLPVVITLPPTRPLPTTPTPSPTPLVTNTPLPGPSPTLLPSPTPCAVLGGIVTGSYPSRLAGPTRTYRIYLPPCYGADDRVYPTLYMLHGNATNDNHWDVLGLDEAAAVGIAAAVIPPLLIVMPEGGAIANNSSGGPFSFEGVVVNELIPFIESNYCAWSAGSGRAIGGLSRGGYWALEIAFRQPELFGAVGGHSAALLDSFAGPDLNPQSTVLNSELGDLRIYLDIGETDYVIAPLRQLHESMVTAGIEHTWVLNSGSHEDSYWMAHLDEYLAWYSELWPKERGLYPRCDHVVSQ
jgi:enterochelin esterase-like enzyme